MSIALSSFTTGQVTFIQQLAANAGLDPGVVAAWVYAEENGAAAQSRQASGYHDWLNIGWTDTGRAQITFDPAWNNVTAAANATANWLGGRFGQQYGYVAASSIQKILGAAGSSPAAQIQAIQSSGWASSGYPLLAQVYGELDPTLKKSLGAGVAKGGVAGAGGSGTVTDGSSSTTYAFEIGGAGNPDEDSWTGVNRLAQEVNWYLFSSGEYLYYMDGEEMLAQIPAATIDRVADAARIHQNQGSLSYDNTAFNYVSDRKRRFRTQRRTKVALAQSPTEGTFELICGIDEILGGDVVQLVNFGLADGKWIVAESRRSVFGIYSELTLVPALAPISELAAGGTTGTSSTSGTSTSTVNLTGVYPVKLTGTLRNHVVQVALAAVAREKAQGAYNYGPVRPYPSSLFGPAPITTDCSGFAILCYKDARAPDPNGTSFDGTGSTYTLIAKGTSVSIPQPGDLVFYNVPGDTQPSPNHVNVYVGNAQCCNMGSQGEPAIVPMNFAPVVAVRSYL